MTTEQKFNYIKNFGTYGLDGDVYYCLKLENADFTKFDENYTILCSNGYWTHEGFALLEKDVVNPSLFVECSTFEQFVKKIYGANASELMLKLAENVVDTAYTELKHFEAIIKQLNGGDE